MKTLIIDNFDSFTFNLFQMIAEVNRTPPIVVRNTADWVQLRKVPVDNVVISPGPGRPENPSDFGCCADALRYSEVPILAVCLGHQGLAHVCGGKVVHAPEVMHGRSSRVRHNGDPLFRDIPRHFDAIRYHSLAVRAPLPQVLEPIAWTDDGVIMAMRHASRPVWGVQFHPESIGTEHGRTLLQNFAALTSEVAADGSQRKAVSVPAEYQSPRETEPSAEDVGAGARRLAWRRLSEWREPEDVFVCLFGNLDDAFWLDSAQVIPGLSRFSIMGCRDATYGEAISYTADSDFVTVRRGAQEVTIPGDVFDYLDRRLRMFALPSSDAPFPFRGGYVGYFGYELKHTLGAAGSHSSRLPDAQFIFAERFIVFDHQEEKVYLAAVAPQTASGCEQEWLDQTERAVYAVTTPPAPRLGSRGAPVDFYLEDARHTYLENIEQCMEALHEGESYELCLTTQLYARFASDPLTLHRVLRERNPAPYAAFIRFPGVGVACSSPERFLRADANGWVESKPIKGTLPRGKTPSEDERLRAQLANSEKDRAENLMIVDLVRNDLGQTCAVGSVHVPKRMAIESYATVHQMVSTVRGRLRPELSIVNCIRAAFPGGSMTGAPKLRTMEILDSLEGRPRGIYSGALGWLGLDGAADLNIVIRTAVVRDGEVRVGAGGAIVALSAPEAEFEEMLLKADAVMRSVALTESGSTEVNVQDRVKECDEEPYGSSDHEIPASPAA